MLLVEYYCTYSAKSGCFITLTPMVACWYLACKILLQLKYDLKSLNPLTAIIPKMPVPKPILDTTQILFATILFVCFDN